MVDFTILTARMTQSATISWLDDQIMKQAFLVYLLFGQLVGLSEIREKIEIKHKFVEF